MKHALVGALFLYCILEECRNYYVKSGLDIMHGPLTSWHCLPTTTHKMSAIQIKKLLYFLGNEVTWRRVVVVALLTTAIVHAMVGSKLSWCQLLTLFLLFFIGVTLVQNFTNFHRLSVLENVVEENLKYAVAQHD